ncbi:23S rRNA (cytosine1962-C5)-methyltransferase [Amphibacillus marinus]|uniref:23S rRNA (Cytosine1962-C5)-methyltransferase n=1 Tax=Amphibacillus marinus TaxID=872970 RepID=A0A1H8L5J6_9BACI|nr:class I SAM-dependent rRNA methyltransferase [Amphibacillus marinus]SEO00452.1 23S rRNA (cytosine1962-C5)-methyltransferase [Amphibacillus marinus]
MQKVTVRDKFITKYQKGYPQLFADALEGLNQLKYEGETIDLVDKSGDFIARGYYGRDNKGYGWVLTANKEEQINFAFFSGKIAEAFAKRAQLLASQETTAFRIFNGEGDGIGGLSIDYYAEYLLVTWYSEGIYHFKQEIIEAIQDVLQVAGIYEKKRFDTGGKYLGDDDFVTGQRAQFPLIVKENGLQFATYLNDGPMTGIFLDQRQVRQTIRDHYAAGKTVLNTFSYTGAFSVYAAMGGAAKTVSVDLANRSQPKTIEQFQLNGINETKHEIRVMDVFNYFKYAVKKELKFDLVIVDPPSFARSKKRVFSVTKNYVELLADVINVTEENGVIVASTNSSAISVQKFKQFIKQAFAKQGISYNIERTFNLPEDFAYHPQYADGNYLKVLFIRKLS